MRLEPRFYANFVDLNQVHKIYDQKHMKATDRLASTRDQFNADGIHSSR